MKSLLALVGRSRLLEWLIAYMAFAWLAAQIVSIIADVWDLSNAFQRRAHLALAFGVPMTAVLAWFHGEKGEQQFARSELLVLAALFGLAAIAVPSVGEAGTTGIFGIPSSLIVPCALITMIVIPAWLIALSVYRGERSETENPKEPDADDYYEKKEALWHDLTSAKSSQEMALVRERIDHLLAEYPQSLEVKALWISANKMAFHLSPDGVEIAHPVTPIVLIHEDVNDDYLGGMGPDRTASKGSIFRTYTLAGPVAGDEASPKLGIKSVARRIGKELNRRNVTLAIMIYAFVVFAFFCLYAFAAIAAPTLAGFGTLMSGAAVFAVFGFSVLVVLFWFHGGTDNLIAAKRQSMDE